MKATSSEAVAAKTASSKICSIFAKSQPTTRPAATPPTETRTNSPAAFEGENVPDTTATVANFSRTRPVESLTRLSPSRMVMSRRGSFSLWAMAAAATASGGETMAPRTKQDGHPIPGTMACTAAATTVVVARTRPTARREMETMFARKSRQDVK